jgi:uncharacterized protein (DUF2267 family)
MLNFDEYRYKAIKFYKKVSRELKRPEELAYADRIVSCFLNVLRERTTFAESLELLTVLPMHVKGVYVHGWRLNNEPKRLASEEEFLNAIRIKFPHTTGQKPGTDEDLKNDIRRLISVMQREASAKGVNDIRQLLPGVLHPFCEHHDASKPVVEVINEGSRHFPEVQPIKNEV